MTPRASRAALAGLVGVAAFGLALGGQGSPTRPSRPVASATPASPAPPRLDRADIDRQDRVSAAHRRREARAVGDRPLLAVLPLELAGVRIDIVGLAADDRTTKLAVRPGPRGQGYARALYRRTLAAYGDSGRAYSVRWVR